jgi:hypothetical protein
VFSICYTRLVFLQPLDLRSTMRNLAMCSPLTICNETMDNLKAPINIAAVFRVTFIFVFNACKVCSTLNDLQDGESQVYNLGLQSPHCPLSSSLIIQRYTPGFNVDLQNSICSLTNNKYLNSLFWIKLHLSRIRYKC